MTTADHAGPASAALRAREEGGRLPDRVVSALADIVGRGGVVVTPGGLLPYESDALTRFRQLPAAVVLPRDTDETAAVVRVLSEARVPLTPRGAGTGLSGGAVASPGGVLVGTARMNRILEVDPDHRLARVQAGVVNTDLSEAVAPHGLHYAPDPSSQTACTLGGNVGENAGGPHCLKYGVTTRYVTGLTVVTGGGEVVELGGAHRCEPLDLVGLFVGSEGLLGLATELELRLLPRPRSVRTLLAVFPDMEAAGEAVTSIIAAGLLPAAMEMMDRGSIEAVEASVFAAGYPRDAGAVLVVEFDGTEEGLDADAAEAEALCRERGATQLRRARDDAERTALWQGRKKAYGAFGRIAPDLMVQDATVPRSALPRVLREIEAVGRRHELRMANVFHAGDGNLHPKILFDRRDPGMLDRVERASREIMRICVDAGGTITGEHGVGLDKRDYMSLVHGPRELAVMRRVQEVFDPEGLWNPGKVLPEPGTSDAHTGAPALPGDRPPLRHAPDDLTLSVDAGVPFREIVAGLAEAGQWLPLDVPGAGDRTVGDVVAEGLWGPLAPAYGRIRDLVLGATLEVDGGEVLRLGGRVMKNVAGLDLVRMVPGNRGRLGEIREVIFRLLPLPAAHRVLTWEAGSGTADPWQAARRLLRHPVLPASVVRLPRAEGGRVRVRLLGSRETVEAEARELAEELPGSATWVGPEPTGGFLEADPVTADLTVHGTAPVELEIRGGRSRWEAVEDRIEAAGLGTGSLYHLPLWNVWRLALPDPEPGAGLEDLAKWIRREGGDLAVLRGPGEMRSRAMAEVGSLRRLEEGVSAAVRGGGP